MHQQRISKTPRRRRRQQEAPPLVTAPAYDLTSADELLVSINQVLEVM